MYMLTKIQASLGIRCDNWEATLYHMAQRQMTGSRYLLCQYLSHSWKNTIATNYLDCQTHNDIRDLHSTFPVVECLPQCIHHMI